MRNRHLLILAALVMVSAVAWSPLPTPAGAQTPSPTFAVTPDQDLVDGQAVRYDGAGFSPGTSMAVLQCVPGATSLTEVLSMCVVRQSATADTTGSFTGFVTVSRFFQPMSGSVLVDCAAAAGACAITAFNLSTTIIDALISFADPSLPRPEISVSPASDLDDGDVVTVTGSGFPAAALVTVTQCLANRPATAEWCDNRAPVEVSTGSAGGFTVEATIHRGITTPSGSVTDCASDGSSPCNLTAFTGDGASWASATIALIHRRVLAMPSSPLVVSPQGTVELTGSVFCSAPTSRDVEVSGIITQTVEERVISSGFSATTSCPVVFGVWSTQIGGSRTTRFKAGTATITTWAVEEADPLPDDAERLSRDVELTRRGP